MTQKSSNSSVKNSEHKFEVVSPFEPRGSQPEAIKKLVEGLKKNYKFQTLLGVTGSGKTFSMAKVVEKLQRPTLVLAHNKTLAAQLYNEFQDFYHQNEFLCSSRIKPKIELVV